MGIKVNGAIPIYVDNKSLIDISETMKNSKKTNHINVSVQYLRDMINSGEIELLKILTDFNVADIHTKCLVGAIYKSHRRKLMEGFGGDAANLHRHMGEGD